MLMVTMAGADGIFTNRSELALKVYGRAVPTSDFESLWRQIGYWTGMATGSCSELL